MYKHPSQGTSLSMHSSADSAQLMGALHVASSFICMALQEGAVPAPGLTLVQY